MGALDGSCGRRDPRATAVAFDRSPIWVDAVVRLAEDVGVAVVGATTDTQEVVRLLDEYRPDLFLLGLDRDPLDTSPYVGQPLLEAAQIRQLTTIVLAFDRDPAFAEQCLAAGADAYVLKTVRPTDLSSTIRQTIDRCVFLFARPSAIGSPEASPEEGAHEHLTLRELGVLRLVADGLTNAEVARQLWISEPTVKFHLSSVYEKLNVSNRTGAARWAQRHGLLSIE